MTFSCKRYENRALQGGVDMQSSHACAGFMKVGRFCKKSPPERLREAISQLLGPCCDAFGSTLRTFGRPCGNFFPHCVFITIICNFSGKRAPPLMPETEVGGMSTHPLAEGENHHFHLKCEKTLGKTHFGKVVISRADRKGGLLRGKVSQRSPSPLKAWR